MCNTGRMDRVGEERKEEEAAEKESVEEKAIKKRYQETGKDGRHEEE